MTLVLITIVFCTFCISVVFNYCKNAYDEYRIGNRARANHAVQQQWHANFVAHNNLLEEEEDDEVPIQMEDFIQQEMQRPLPLQNGNRTQTNDLLRFPIDDDLNVVTVV